MITIIYGRLLNLKRNWLPYAFLVALPLFLMIVFGALIGGEEAGIFLPVADLDGSVQSAALVNELTNRGAYNITLTTLEDLQETVIQNRAEAALIIPRGFGEKIAGGETPRFELFVTRETPTGHSLHGVLASAVQRLAYNAAIVQGTVDFLEEHANIGAGGRDKLIERVDRLAAEKWAERLPVRVIGSTLKSGGGADLPFNPYTQTSIGFTLAFAMFTVVFAVGEILEEKRTGVWDRICVSPLSRFQILAGGGISAFVLGMASMGAMALAGDLVLGVNWLGHLGGALVILAAFCFCMVSFGLLLSFGINTPQQLQVTAPVVLVSFAMLGGCYWPLEIVRSKALLAISRAIPAGWAMQALKSIIIYNRGFEAIYLPAAMLLLMGIIFLGLAVQLGDRT